MIELLQVDAGRIDAQKNRLVHISEQVAFDDVPGMTLGAHRIHIVGKRAVAQVQSLVPAVQFGKDFGKIRLLRHVVEAVVQQEGPLFL